MTALLLDEERTEDDLWIPSHIPELIDELDCHIFVDVAFTVAVFMYLYKIPKVDSEMTQRLFKDS